jgi:Contractile injection system tube protein
MTTFPGSPQLLKGGIVLLDPNTGQPVQIIVLQYNPDTLTRTLQVQGIGPEPGDRMEALRLKGPPLETLKLDAEIDATDQMEKADPTTAQLGIYPQLAALETIVYPSSRQLQANDSQAQMGTLEIAPMEAPLALFIWSQVRVLPVRVTDFSITEEAFDPNLNPIRAKVSLGMRVLTVNDLGFAHKGGNLFMTYLQQKEQLVAKSPKGTLGALGLKGIP